MKYELTDLRLFHAIAEAQHLSAGAESLFMSASSASYRIKNLESAMGTALFVRTPFGMVLTPAGETALTYVRQVLSAAENMEYEVQRLATGDRGHVRLIANSSALNGFVIPSLGRYLAANPRVNVDLEELPSPEVVAAISSGESDIGLLAKSSDLTNVRSVPFATDELILVTPPGHELAGQRDVKFFAALRYDFIGVERDSSNYLFLSSIARQAGVALNVRIHATGFDAALTLVAAGAGVSVVPRSVAAAHLLNQDVGEAKLDEQWAKRDLVLITGKSGAATEHARSLIEFLLGDTSSQSPS